MAETASEQAGAMFSGGARRATTALQQATREARKALEAVGGFRSSMPPPVIDWQAMDVKGWERQGMLSVFRMRGGSILFTPARDVVKPDVNGGGLIVQVYYEEDGDPYPLAVERLVQESDGVLLQGVLSQRVTDRVRWRRRCGRRTARPGRRRSE
eukprot:488773-Pleurochrysis_carterae.AAC.1